MPRGKASVDALELQRLLMSDARNPETVASVRSQIARAWVDLQEMRLRLAMKPAPKPIDVTLVGKGRSPAFARAKVSRSDPTQAPIVPNVAPPDATT
jgi:hypothetical protein